MYRPKVQKGVKISWQGVLKISHFSIASDHVLKYKMDTGVLEGCVFLFVCKMLFLERVA